MCHPCCRLVMRCVTGTRFPFEQVRWGFSAWLLGTLTLALVALVATPALAQTTSIGRLDFLKSKDASFALFANTSSSNTGQPYPNDLVLLTGLPFKPVISARLGLFGPSRVCRQCGGLRSVAISPDGDTALVTSDPTSVNNPAATRTSSALFVVRNLRTFVKTKNPDDLRITTFKASEYPDLDNVAGLAFGPDGRWAVANSVSQAYDDGTYTAESGRVIVITGLPDNPVFSAPIPVPMHSLGTLDFSLDGGTLLLNDVNDFTDGGFKSDQIVVQGIRPGGPVPRVAAVVKTFRTEIFRGGPPTVRQARLTLDGRFIVAPISGIRSLDANQMPVPLDEIAIMGPVRKGRLDITRLLNENDGVRGGPFQLGISPDGDSALVGNALDSGGANLVTGLSTGDSARIKVKALPFGSFGPPYPQGPNGPPVLAPHGPVVYTPDGQSAVVVNFITPPLVGAKLTPSLSLVTGFRTGDLQVAAILNDPTLNPFDFPQQVATPPAGLMDYVSLYVPAGSLRESLLADLNTSIADADRGDRDGEVVDHLAGFIRTLNRMRGDGVLTSSQVGVMEVLGVAGIQALTGRTENVSGAGSNPGSVSPDSIASLQVSASYGSTPASFTGSSLTIIDSTGVERPARLLAVSAGRIDYLVPPETAIGKGLALVSTGTRITAAATVSIETTSPGLYTLAGGNMAAALVQRIRADGTQSIEPVTGPIDLGPATDKVFLLLFGTGFRGRHDPHDVTAKIGGKQVDVTFAGPQGGFDGLDQVNLSLSSTLAGLGKADIAIDVNGSEVNIVQISIR